MDALLTLLGAAGCSFIMGVPGADDVMLNYQSTSYHDALYVRRALAKRPAPEFEAWLERMGILDGQGRPPGAGRRAGGQPGRGGAARDRPPVGASSRRRPSGNGCVSSRPPASASSRPGPPSRRRPTWTSSGTTPRPATPFIPRLDDGGTGGGAAGAGAGPDPAAQRRGGPGRVLAAARPGPPPGCRVARRAVVPCRRLGTWSSSSPTASPPPPSTATPSRCSRRRCRRLRREGWRIGPVALVAQGRVASGDEVGQGLGAAMVVVLVGERPGLSSPDSLGAYLTWQPRPGDARLGAQLPFQHPPGRPDVCPRRRPPPVPDARVPPPPAVRG